MEGVPCYSSREYKLWSSIVRQTLMSLEDVPGDGGFTILLTPGNATYSFMNVDCIFSHISSTSASREEVPYEADCKNNTFGSSLESRTTFSSISFKLSKWLVNFGSAFASWCQ
jgi:hypothetical protein